MQPGQRSALQMPSFLHGSAATTERKAHAEGRRCGQQYLKSGSFPAPRELLEVPAGDVVVTQAGADLQREPPAWRLYSMWNVLEGLFEAIDWQNTSPIRDAFETLCRGTPWGALYFTLAQAAPMSAQRVALRLQAVLQFWGPLQSVRYLFKAHGTLLSLEELMVATCDWAMDAWCPVGETSIRKRLEEAAKQMARATREDCIEAMLRQMPHVLTSARGLTHRDVLASPTTWRQHLAVLDQESFERMSSACTSDLLAHLYAWDRELGEQ